MCNAILNPVPQQGEQHAIPAWLQAPIKRRARVCRRCGNALAELSEGTYVCCSCPLELAVPGRAIDNPLLSPQVRMRLLERDIRQFAVDMVVSQDARAVLEVLADRLNAIRNQISR